MKLQGFLGLSRCANVFPWIVQDPVLPKAVYTVSHCIYSFIYRVSQTVVPHPGMLGNEKELRSWSVSGLLDKTN